MTTPPSNDRDGTLLNAPDHRAWLRGEALRQFEFFRASLHPVAGFYTLEHDGTPRPDDVQELHTTTRLVHSYALGHIAGVAGADAIVDQGMRYLRSGHRDAEYGGYLWALNGDQVADGRKLAYGHVFVLLAGASALQAGHPDAGALIDDVASTLDQHFWDETQGLFRDEWNRDWTPFSDYRGMNANMHAVEALLSAHEATGRADFLDRAGRILAFFTEHIAPAEGWRLPEHYTAQWQIDRAYAGNPMFRPAGTTPGHSFELGRLLLQYWDLRGRPSGDMPLRARRLIEQALAHAWVEGPGGFAYTLDFAGRVDNAARYWWPVAEAIGAMAALIKLDGRPEDEAWYRRLWAFADQHLIDHERGGWYPELDDNNRPAAHQFVGKPDIYHSIQAALLPLATGLSHAAKNLRGCLS